MNINDFISRYPTLYHMAENGAWGKIKTTGLLSTKAALDFAGVHGNQRLKYEREQRTKKYVLGNGVNTVTLRDQKPMSRDRLLTALTDGTTPEEWYYLINQKVFLWAQKHRLMRLLNAREYRGFKHDVIEVDTKSLLSEHLDKMWLSRMNSGNTFPIPHKRGKDLFLRLRDYPVRKNGNPIKEVVEVVFDYSIPNIAKYVKSVKSYRGAELLGTDF